MENRENLDFRIYNKKEISSDTEYVKMQAGRGKKADGSINIKFNEFQYIEGIIVDKYREYSMSTENKISSSDWSRIMDEFKEATVDLLECKTQDDVDDILKLRNHDLHIDLESVLEYKEEIIKLLTGVNAWLTKKTQDEHYILIIKKRDHD